MEEKQMWRIVVLGLRLTSYAWKCPPTRVQFLYSKKDPDPFSTKLHATRDELDIFIIVVNELMLLDNEICYLAAVFEPKPEKIWLSACKTLVYSGYSTLFF